MADRKKLVIGLFGFGTVGKALYNLLETTRPDGVRIKRICVRDISKNRGIEADFTDNYDSIFNDPEINLIVELVDDARASYAIITRALREGMSAVSGNKKMLAEHLPELIEMQKQTGSTLLYDASACGSIPVIRNLEEYYDNELLVSVKGILNGSSNYILTKIFNHGMTYEAALREAQEAGFAESDPSLDVDGWDSLSKLIIITVHAFGTYIAPENIFTFGISNLRDYDIRFAREKGRRIKLVGHVEKLADGRLVACVIPQLLSKNKYIYGVDDEFNGVVIKGLYYDKQFMFGRGAALREAQEAGFAESDPSLDVDGWDSLSKLIIITVHAFGTYIAPENIFTFGISNLRDYDIRFAREKGRRIKLVGHVEKLADGRLVACVIPQLLSKNKYIYGVDDEFNGVVIKGLYYDKQFMFGRGAGGFPTGSAILSDITACQYDYKYEYKKRLTHLNDLPEFTNDVHFRVFFRYRNPEDLNLIEFDSISEKYSSADFNYVVGHTSLADLHRVAALMRDRDVFIAAYPPD